MSQRELLQEALDTLEDAAQSVYVRQALIEDIRAELEKPEAVEYMTIEAEREKYIAVIDESRKALKYFFETAICQADEDVALEALKAIAKYEEINESA